MKATYIIFFFVVLLVQAAQAEVESFTEIHRERFSSAAMEETSRAFKPRGVTLRFVHSPYADYLFYLLYRNSNEFSSISKVLPLDNVETVQGLISLPEDMASANIKYYKEIYPFLEDYRRPPGRIVLKPKPKILGYGSSMPSYDRLVSIIHEGEKTYPTFFEFWQKEIKPAEMKTIATWKQQEVQCNPMKRLQELERLRFPFPSLDVGAIAFHFAGSGNYSPAGVYTRLFTNPNLAWVLGHEATHLQVDKYIGHDWTNHPMAAEAIAAVQKRGGKPEDIEESLCLFMQVTLSQECGNTSKARRISDQLNDSPLKQKICKALENEWSDYLVNPQKYPTVIDYMLHATVKATRS